MIFRRFILGALASTSLLTASVRMAHAQTVSPTAAKAFISQSGDKLIGILNSNGNNSQKAAALSQLVDQIVNVDQVATYVLGRRNSNFTNYFVSF